MTTKIVPFNNEIEILIEFLKKNTWSFHGTSKKKTENIRRSYETGYYMSDEARTFWIVNNQEEKVGIIRIYDLEDDCPLFDIKIDASNHGKG